MSASPKPAKRAKGELHVLASYDRIQVKYQWPAKLVMRFVLSIVLSLSAVLIQRQGRGRVVRGRSRHSCPAFFRLRVVQERGDRQYGSAGFCAVMGFARIILAVIPMPVRQA
jgi:hypothetical protein